MFLIHVIYGIREKANNIVSLTLASPSYIAKDNDPMVFVNSALRNRCVDRIVWSLNYFYR